MQADGMKTTWGKKKKNIYIYIYIYILKKKEKKSFQKMRSSKRHAYVW